MKPKFKEDPKAWRKTTILSVLGLAVCSSVLRWKRIIPQPGWLAALVVLAFVALVACAVPRWFRGYYRFSQRLGLHLSQWLGWVALACFFVLVVTPMGLLLRVLGKDLLRLKRPARNSSCWLAAKANSSLDEQF